MKDSQYESVYDFLPFFVCAITFAHVCACMPYSYSHKHNTKVQIDIPGVYIQLHNNKPYTPDAQFCIAQCGKYTAQILVPATPLKIMKYVPKVAGVYLPFHIAVIAKSAISTGLLNPVSFFLNTSLCLILLFSIRNIPNTDNIPRRIIHLIR